MIELCGIGKQYGATWSLEPITAQMDTGRIIALCGSNGAGKSTLLNLLNRTIRPSVGHASINGVTTQERSYCKTFGYMPDDFMFDGTWTVGETYAYYARLQQTQPSREGLIRVGLQDQVNQRVASLSKGMRQRLLLAQALVTRAAVLLLDEPTNGLDPIWMDTLQVILQEEAMRGATIVFSTHQLDVASRIADEIWVLTDGRLVERLNVEEPELAYATLQHFFFPQKVDTCQMRVTSTK